MKNKKTIMAFSALQILFFHLWICMWRGNVIETFFKQTAYLGVDIFFFLSAFSLGNRQIKDYFSFLLARFQTVYAKFFLFAVVAFFYSKWTIRYFLEVISGGNLIKNGGGAFLWFLPAIMAFYILFPLFQKADMKNRWLTLMAVVVLWLGLALVLSQNKKFAPFYIYWNRIPIFLLGYYSSKLTLWDKKKIRIPLGIFLTVTGYILVYFFAYKSKLQVPVKDMFYLMVIPASLGLILLVGLIPEFRVIRWIGSSTLEMYAIQMIFGYNVENFLLKKTKMNLLLSNVGAMLFVILVAIVVHYGYEYLLKGIKTITNKR